MSIYTRPVQKWNYLYKYYNQPHNKMLSYEYRCGPDSLHILGAEQYQLTLFKAKL